MDQTGTGELDWSVPWLGKKRVKRLREAPPGDTSVLFGKPFGRKTPSPQTDLVVEARILAIRDAPPPENLKRTPGPRAILYYLSRDPSLQECAEILPRSTCTIWKILRRNDRITQEKRRKHKPPQQREVLEDLCLGQAACPFLDMPPPDWSVVSFTCSLETVQVCSLPQKSLSFHFLLLPRMFRASCSLEKGTALPRCLPVYDLRKLVGSQGSKVIH